MVRRAVLADRSCIITPSTRRTYSGRTTFQRSRSCARATFGKMLILDGDTQSSQGRREDLSRDARPSGAGGAADRREVLILGRRRGRDAARGAAPSRRRALHDGRHRRRGRRALQEVSAGVVATARSTIRARTSSSATRWLSCAKHDERFGVDRLRSDRAARQTRPRNSALQRRGLSRHQGAAWRGRHLRAASQHRRLPQHGAARQDGAHAAPHFAHVALVFHARAGLRYRLGLSRVQRPRRSRGARPGADRRLRRPAARRELLLRRRDAPAALFTAALPASRARAGRATYSKDSEHAHGS